MINQQVDPSAAISVCKTNEIIDENFSTNITEDFSNLLDLSNQTQNHQESANFSKREKREMIKLQQRKQEAYKMFAKLEGLGDKLPFSKLPRKTLVIVNLGFGAVGGADTNQIEAIFSKFKGFEKVVMAHGKPYTFLEFRGGDDSQIARNELHEKPCPELNNKILFIEFVNHQDFVYLSDRIYNGFSKKLDTVPGLRYSEDFLTQDEESELLALIGYNSIEDENQNWLTAQNRKIQHYKNSFDYKKKHVGNESLVAHKDIPELIQKYLDRAKKLHDITADFDQLSVQSYPPGTGISFHADSHTAFNDPILIISLLNPIVMEFRHPPTHSSVALDLQPRSLVVLSEDARFGWEHGIRARKSDMIDKKVRLRTERWSLTIRSVNKLVSCNCKYPALCDRNTIYVRKIRESNNL